MQEKIKRLVEWSRGKKLGPLSIEIWPTNKCNLKCVMCGTWAERERLMESGKYDKEEEERGEMCKEKFVEILKESIELGVKECLITGGGEPLVKKPITFGLAELAKKHGMYGNINTNGTLFTKEDIIKLIEIGWDRIMFSIDGPDAETHDFIRSVPGTFDRCMNSLQLLKNLKEEYSKDKPAISFNVVIHNRNYKNLSEMIKLAQKVNCEDITFMPLIPFENMRDTLNLDKEQWNELRKLVPYIKKLSEKYGVTTNIEEFSGVSSHSPNGCSPEAEIEAKTETEDGLSLSNAIGEKIPLFSYLPCYEPFLHIVVKPGGHVSPCCMIYGEDNIKEKSLEDVWFGEYFNSLRNLFLRKKIPKECSTCVHSQFVRNKILREKLKNILFNKSS